MPFIKETDPKTPFYLTDTRKLFIGRINELQFFLEKILKPEYPAHNIISISGQGGVGKSTLLSRFIDEARATNLKDYCVTATIDERQTTPASMMEKFATQLREAGYPLDDFDRALSRYKEDLRKLQIQRDTTRENFWRKTTTDITSSLIKDVPVAGTILEKGAAPAIDYIFDEFHYHQVLKDAQRMEDPVGNLTRAFVEDINRCTGISITLPSSRIKRRLRIILFFDTFEQLDTEAVPWLLNHFLPANINCNIILVIAGRDPIDHSTPNDPKQWQQYYYDNTLYHISLNSFTKEETQTYLIERNIVDPMRIATLWQLSQGLPLYLSLLTSNSKGEVDPTADVVANFLRWIPPQEKVKRRLALDAALFSRHFNQDDLEAFTYLPDDDDERMALYHWLVTQPFVSSNLQDGLYNYHDLAQELFSRHLYQRSLKEYFTTRKALADHYQKLLQKTEADGGRRVYSSAQWLSLALALIHQLFALPDEINHTKAIEQALEVYLHVDGAEEIVRALHQISQEQSTTQISSTAREDASQLLKYIEAKEADEGGPNELIAAANYLLKTIKDKPSFSSELLANIYHNRGLAYHSLGKNRLALTDFHQALTTNHKLYCIYGHRGCAYYALKDYQQAIVEFNHCLKRDASDTHHTSMRGHAYLQLGQFSNALADFDHIIQLHPQDSMALLSRGRVYQRMHQYDKALKDIESSIALNSKNAHVGYKEIGSIYISLEKYQEAADAFLKALKDEPACYDCWDSLTATYVKLFPTEEIPKRLRDIDISWQNNPQSLAYRAEVMRCLGFYQDALAEIDQAIMLDTQYAWAYGTRGQIYQALKLDDRAIVDFDYAADLGLNEHWLIEDQCKIYLSRKQHENVLAIYSNAISLNPQDDWAYSNRADVLRALGRYEESLEDYNRAVKYNKNNHLYNERGLAFSYLKLYKEAVEIYQEGLKENPEDLAFLYNVAVTIARWKGPLEAAEYINAARTALVALPDYAYALYGLGGLQAIANNTEEALDYLQRAIFLEEEVIDSAQHDIAWLDLRTNPRFQMLISRP
jgi:tetratricopeptide (TPR) repeat protein